MDIVIRTRDYYVPSRADTLTMTAEVIWQAHCRFLDLGSTKKVLMSATIDGIDFGHGDTLVSWDRVSDIFTVPAPFLGIQRVAVQLVVDGVPLRFLVSSGNWWGAFPQVLAVDAAHALRQAKSDHGLGRVK